MNTIRSFLGIKVSLQAARAIAEAQTALKDRCAGSGVKVSWVPPANLHVTMCFLGQIAEPMAYAIKDMLKPIVSRWNAFDFETAGLGAFPNLDSPRTLWAGVKEGSDKLEELHKAVAARLTEAGFGLDDKPFRTHVTIGRIKGGPTEPLAAFLQEHTETPFGTTVHPELICYRSDLKPHGAEYFALWHLPFGQGIDNGEQQPAIPGSEIS